jgi:hypothetical protein
MSAAASITVRVPLTVRRRPGRKTVVTPQGAATPLPARSRADPALVKALARAHRWQRMLDNGRYASISEMAAAEKIDRGYLGRILQLTLFAPDIVEAVLDWRQPTDLALPALLEPFPADWERQRDCAFFVSRSDEPAAPRPPAAAPVGAAPMRLETTPLPGLPAEDQP